MTTIVYRDGVLAADRKVSFNTGEWRYNLERDKLHLHPSKMLAYTFTGSVNKHSDHELLGDWLLTLSRLIENGDCVREFLADIPKELDNIVPIWITKRGAYSIRENQIELIDQVPFYANGSGMWCALACLDVGVTFKKLFVVTAGIDCCTSTEFTQIKQSSLRIIKVKK